MVYHKHVPISQKCGKQYYLPIGTSVNVLVKKLIQPNISPGDVYKTE